MELSTGRTVTIAEALRFAWGQLKAHVNPLMVFGVVGAFLALLNSALQRTGREGGVLALGIQVLQAAVVLALIRVAMQLHDGQSLTVSTPTTMLRGFGSYLLTGLLYGLIVAGGMVLLIVPGFIWGVMFGLAPFLVADGETHPLAALKASARLTRGVRWPLFGFALAMFGVNLLGLLAFGVGVIVTMPLTILAAVYVLRALQGRTPAETVVHPPPLPTPHAA